MLPNSSISGERITNYSTLGRRRIVLSIGVSYDAAVPEVRTALLEAAASIETLLDDPAPVVYVTAYRGKLHRIHYSLLVRMGCFFEHRAEAERGAWSVRLISIILKFLIIILTFVFWTAVQHRLTDRHGHKRRFCGRLLTGSRPLFLRRRKHVSKSFERCTAFCFPHLYIRQKRQK